MGILMSIYEHQRGILAFMVLMILGLVFSMADYHKKKVNALLRLIEKENPELYAKITKGKEV